MRSASACVPRGADDLGREPSSIIEYLKRRISQLEAGLHNADQNSSSPSTTPQTTSKVASTPGTVASQPRRDVLQAPTPADPVDNALSQIGVLSLNAMGHSATSARGIADRVACSSLVLEAIGLPALKPSSSFADYRSSRVSGDAMLFKTPVDLNYDALGMPEVIARFSDSAGLYLSGIPDFKCFDIFTTWQTAQRNGTEAFLLDAQPELVLMAKLMLAIGICMDSKRESVDLLVSVLTQDLAQNVTRLQDDDFLRVLILQIILSTCHPLGGAVWPLLGLAMARAISLGFHREDVQSLDAIGEERLGVFWAIYILDRTIATATDRPFALADSDTTLQLDLLPSHADNAGSVPNVQLLRNCMIHHAQLMSRMRHGAAEDGYFHLMNYYHWRDTYQKGIFTNAGEALQSLRTSSVRKHGLQLQCRALVQLSTMLIDGSRECLTQLCNDVMEAVPTYVNYLAQLTDRYAVSLTLVDGLEIFAAAVVFIHFCLPNNVEESDQSYAVRMSLDNMRVAMLSMELLLSVSKRFAEMLSLRDVMWTFMSARESLVSHGSHNAPARSETASSSIAALEEAIGKANVPRNLAAFMKCCLRM